MVKSKRTKTKAQYLLTLIPDKEFYAKNKRDLSRKFINSGDKNNFSGFVLYSRNNVPLLLSRYVKGQKIQGVSLIGVKDKDEYIKRLSIITTKLREMHIQQGKMSIQTRMGGEDDMWSCDCGNCNTCLGNYEFCSCGNCDECGYTCDGCGCNPCGCCNFCGTSPCVCNNFYCPHCYSSFCDGNCKSTVCHNCNKSWCNGECMNQGCGGCGYCDECNPSCDCGDCAKCRFTVPNVGNEEQKNVNKTHTPNSTDSLSNNTIINMVRKAQKGNTCVPTILEYIQKNKGDDTKRKTIIKYYENRLSKDGIKYKVKDDGVPANEVPSGVINFLGSDSMELPKYGGDPPYDYKGAINRGSMVMTNIFFEVDEQTVIHNILVVGYTEDGNYIYIDPNDADNVYECSPDYLNEKNTYKYDFEIKK